MNNSTPTTLSSVFIQKTFSSDQRVRSEAYATAKRYTIDLPEYVNNVIGIQLLDAYIPRSEYIIDSHNDKIDYIGITWLNRNSYNKGNVNTINIPHGNYTINELFDELQNIDTNLVFTISNQKTEQVLISLDQAEPDLNGFQLLFGTGPNNYRSAARELGFETGVDSQISTPPIVFGCIVSKDSDTITTYDSNIANSDDSTIYIGYTMEDSENKPLGYVTGFRENCTFQFSLQTREKQMLSRYVYNDDANTEYDFTVSISIDNPDIYDNDSYTNGYLLNIGNDYIIFHNCMLFHNSDDIVIFKRLGEVFIESCESNIQGILKIKNPTMTTTIKQRSLGENCFFNIKYVTPFSPVSNNSFKYSVNINSLACMHMDENSYIFCPTFMYENSIVQYEFSNLSDTTFEWRQQSLNDTIQNSNSVMWQGLQFDTLQIRPYITNSANSYIGNIRNSVSFSWSDEKYGVYIRMLDYNSMCPNSIGYTFTTASVMLIQDLSDNFVIPIYNSPNNGTMSIQIKGGNSFYWSSASNMANSIFIKQNSFLIIDYNTIEDNTVIYYSSIQSVVNSFNIYTPSSFSGDNGESFNTISTNCNYYIDLQTGDMVYTLLISDPSPITITWDIQQGYSSQIKFSSYEFNSHNSQIIIYSSTSPIGFYKYDIYHGANCIFSDVTNLNSFEYILNSGFGKYTIKFDPDKNSFKTTDTFTFEMKYDNFIIHSHYYSIQSNQYIISKYQLPQSPIKVNGVEYSTENSIVVLNSFSELQSPVFVIDGQSIYFENCVYSNIYFSSVQEILDTSGIKNVTFIPSSYIHNSMIEYKVMYDNSEVIHSIENSFTFSFNSTFLNSPFVNFTFQGIGYDDNNSILFGQSIQYVIYNRKRFYNSPTIMNSIVHVNSIDNSIHYYYGFDIHICRIDKNSWGLNSITITHSNTSNEYTIMKHKYHIYLDDGVNNSYVLTRYIMYNSEYSIYKINTIPSKIPLIKRIVFKTKRDIEYSNEIDVYLSGSAIIMSQGDMDMIYSYKNYILRLSVSNSEEIYYVLSRGKTINLKEIQIDAVVNKTYNNLMLFEHKQLVSPYKYDMEKTPIIQVMCERIGNLYTQAPIGFYNFSHEKIIPNKIQFPILSKASKIEISLKRRNSTMDKYMDEHMYYEWNGMEHTLVVQFECLNIDSESALLLS